MSSRYQYTPLSPGSQTRILELLPSQSNNAPVHATLRDIDIYQHYDFKALSYTWGAPSFTKQIFLENGGRVVGHSFLMITPNLHDALVRFRDSHEVVRIWVDALCINQGDDAEKAKQIPFMDSIYRTATKVLVWLGNYHDEAASIQSLNSASRRLESQDIGNIIYPHVQKTVRLPWFTRRWIVQEAVLNNEVYLYCGEKSTIAWSRLLDVVLHLRRFQVSDEKLQAVRTMALLAENSRARSRNEAIPETGILDVLTSFSNLGCMDDRDRIYALAGLASDITMIGPGQSINNLSGAALQADYKKSVENVYIDFVATNLKQLDGWHRVLQIANLRSNGSHLSNKCSWAPDWRLQPVRHSLADDEKVPGLDLTNARIDIKEGSHVLQVEFRDNSGYTPYALIDNLSDPFPTTTSNNDVAAWVRNTWRFLLKHISLTDGINMSNPSTTLQLFTQYERLLLERSNSLKHHNGADHYDTFQSSAEFIHIISPNAKRANGATYSAALEAEMFKAIRDTMQGRRIFLGRGSRPLLRKNKKFDLGGLLGGGSGGGGDKPTNIHWPAIGVAADYALPGDVVYTRSVMLRGWRLVSPDGSIDGHGHGYFESQRSETFVLRPLPDANPQWRVDGSGRLGKDKDIMEISTGLLHLNVAGQGHGQEEQRRREFFYIGECKTSRLLEVQPKGDKLDTRKLDGEVNQGRVRVDTILIR